MNKLFLFIIISLNILNSDGTVYEFYAVQEMEYDRPIYLPNETWDFHYNILGVSNQNGTIEINNDNIKVNFYRQGSFNIINVVKEVKSENLERIEYYKGYCINNNSPSELVIIRKQGEISFIRLKTILVNDVAVGRKFEVYKTVYDFYIK